MKKPKPGWEMLCAHANEVPNVCPCSATCGCRYYACRNKMDEETFKLFFDPIPLIFDADGVTTALPFSRYTPGVYDYAFERQVVKSTKIGQRIYLHIPVSDTHEVTFASRVVSKRKKRIK